jgi:hypothetical protein
MAGKSATGYALPARLPPRARHCTTEAQEPDIDLHSSTADRHAVGVHPRVNIGSAGWVNVGSAPTAVGKAKYLFFTFIAVIGLSFGAIWVYDIATHDTAYVDPSGKGRTRAQIEAAQKQHVRDADEKAATAIAHRVAAFSDFINLRKPGAKPFSNDVASLYGKWRAVKPYLAFTDTDGHKQYVREMFDRNLFSDTELADVVRRTVEECVKDLDSAENELAVALRQEVLGRTLAPGEISTTARAFKDTIAHMVAASQDDAAKAAGSLVVSEVTAQVGTQVLLRLGVAAGILASSAANSWWNFGAALVIGLAVDLVWEWIDDPVGDIERETISALDRLTAEVSIAITEEMATAIALRRMVWNKAILEMEQ